MRRQLAARRMALPCRRKRAGGAMQDHHVVDESRGYPKTPGRLPMAVAFFYIHSDTRTQLHRMRLAHGGSPSMDKVNDKSISQGIPNLKSRALAHFDSYENLHVEINDIRDQIIAIGIQDEIRFHYVDIDPKILRGLLYRYTKHHRSYGDPILCSEICISQHMDHDWQRLVAAKELIHITDTPDKSAQSEQAVEKLIERLSYPLEITLETESSKSDEFALIPALAVLVPKDCRILLRKLHSANTITNVDIAKMAQIPSRYVDVILEEWFDEFVDKVVEETQ